MTLINDFFLGNPFPNYRLSGECVPIIIVYNIYITNVMLA